VTAQPTGDGRTPPQGVLAYFENTIDPATGTLSARGQFPNTDERLWPGQFVEVNVTLRIEPHAITVPSPAVQNGQAGTFVFVVKPDSTVEMRPVTVARTVGTESVIASGLAAGEHVVTSGQLRLVPGATVMFPGPPVAHDGKAPGASGKKSKESAP
jgi:multidrug efflux system membrane fusion protein